MKWTSVNDKMPELILINSTTSISRSYPVFSEGAGVNMGYTIKNLEDEKAYWSVGCLEQPFVVTHWIETEAPNGTN